MIIRDTPEFADDGPTKAELGEFLGKNFPFQFPPRVTSDGKSAEWTETGKFSWEPIAVWNGAAARKLSIEAMYVVDGNSWTGAKIAKIAHAASAYFYRSVSVALKDKGFGPIIEISSLYDAVQEKSTWRGLDVSIARSEYIVNDGVSAVTTSPASSSGTSSSSSFWPMFTKITFNLAAYSKIKDGGDPPIQAVLALEDRPTAKWF